MVKLDKKYLRDYKIAPAYPRSAHAGLPKGLVLSSKMMAALVSNPKVVGSEVGDVTPPTLAKVAVALADALIVEYLKSLKVDG